MALHDRPVEWAENLASSKARVWCYTGVHAFFLILAVVLMHAVDTALVDGLSPRDRAVMVMGVCFLPVTLAGLVFPSMYIWCIHLLIRELRGRDRTQNELSARTGPPRP